MMLRTAVTALAVCIPVAVQAQSNCAPRENITLELETKHQETVVFRGLTSYGDMWEFSANVEADTWTVITTSPEQVSCIRAAGNGVSILAPAVLGVDG